MYTWSALPEEQRFFHEHFPSWTTNSLLVTPKQPGTPLLSAEALQELADLEQWLVALRVPVAGWGEVGLPEVCYRAIDESPEQPCFSIGPLDCWREGRAFVHGGANNSVYYGGELLPGSVL